MVNPFAHGGGRGLPCFLLLLKISSSNPFMKILDLTKLFVADALMEFFFAPSQSTLKYGSENYPWTRELRY